MPTAVLPTRAHTHIVVLTRTPRCAQIFEAMLSCVFVPGARLTRMIPLAPRVLKAARSLATGIPDRTMVIGTPQISSKLFSAAMLRAPVAFVKISTFSAAAVTCGTNVHCVGSDEEDDIMREMLADSDVPSDEEGAGAAVVEAGPPVADKVGDNDGSFDDEHDSDMMSADGHVSPEGHETDSPAADMGFTVGSPVIVTRGGKWSGEVVVFGSNPTNFLTYGKIQVRYGFKTKKGRGFSRTTFTAWVSPSDLEKRLVSPRAKVQKTTAGSSTTAPASVAVSRPTGTPN